MYSEKFNARKPMTTPWSLIPSRMYPRRSASEAGVSRRESLEISFFSCKYSGLR